eukprot:766498-Hanusia_phi.AAC.5
MLASEVPWGAFRPSTSVVRITLRPAFQGWNGWLHRNKKESSCSLLMCGPKASSLRRNLGLSLIALSLMSSLNFSQSWIATVLSGSEVRSLSAEISSDCNLMARTRDILTENFVDWTGKAKNLQQLAICLDKDDTPTDNRRAGSGTVSDVLKSLGDKYTRLVSGTEMKETMRQFDNLGAGIVLSTIEDQPKVGESEKRCVGTDLFVGYTTHETEGLERGDSVVRVNGEDAMCLSRFEAADLLQRSPDTIKFDVLRADKSQDRVLSTSPVSVLIGRDRAEREKSLYHVVKQVSGRQVGYIKIPQFTAGAARSFDAALAELEDETFEASWGNKGGLVSEAQQIAVVGSREQSSMLNTADLDKKRSKTVSAAIPVAVLVDGDSASASEFLAISLKEERNAVSVSERAMSCFGP